MARTTKLSDSALGIIGYAKVDVPVRPKGSGAWAILPRKLALQDGYTAADAETFGAELRASAERYSDAWDNRPAACGFSESSVPNVPLSPRPGQTAASFARECAEIRDARPAALAAAAERVPARGSVTVADVSARFRNDAGLAEITAAYHAARADGTMRAELGRIVARQSAERAAAELSRVAHALATSGPVDVPSSDPAPGIVPAADDMAPYRAAIVAAAEDRDAPAFLAARAAMAAAEPIRIVANSGTYSTGPAAMPAPEPGAPDDAALLAAAELSAAESAAADDGETLADAELGPEPVAEPSPYALPDPAASRDALAPESAPVCVDCCDAPAVRGDRCAPCGDALAMESPEPYAEPAPERRAGPLLIELAPEPVDVPAAVPVDVPVDVPAPEPTLAERRDAAAAERLATMRAEHPDLTGPDSSPMPAEHAPSLCDAARALGEWYGWHPEYGRCAAELAADAAAEPAVLVAEPIDYSADTFQPDMSAPAAEYAAEHGAELYTVPAPEPTAPVLAPEPMPAPIVPADMPAPVLAILPAPTGPAAGRPACGRCGQTFRAGGSGYQWHIANRPDCAEIRRPSAVA